MKIAFFDFDGTITYKDSTINFIRFIKGNTKFFIGIFILSPFLLLYKLNIISNNAIKNIIIKYYFKDMSIEYFRQMAEKFSLKYIDGIVRDKAIKRIKWHKEQGHTVVIVSASIDLWLKPWCYRNNINLISTKLETKNSKISGICDKNCFGSEKVNRINREYNLSNYDYIYAYGNSKGDYEMLEIADEKYYKPF
tara:strand:+ start:2568 stop:3149 length:582 start_codon:yes stop_codon:yes gene_type:complete